MKRPRAVYLLILPFVPQCFLAGRQMGNLRFRSSASWALRAPRQDPCRRGEISALRQPANDGRSSLRSIRFALQGRNSEFPTAEDLSAVKSHLVSKAGQEKERVCYVCKEDRNRQTKQANTTKQAKQPESPRQKCRNNPPAQSQASGGAGACRQRSRPTGPRAKRKQKRR